MYINYFIPGTNQSTWLRPPGWPMGLGHLTRALPPGIPANWSSPALSTLLSTFSPKPRCWDKPTHLALSTWCNPWARSSRPEVLSRSKPTYLTPSLWVAKGPQPPHPSPVAWELTPPGLTGSYWLRPSKKRFDFAKGFTTGFFINSLNSWKFL